jgi:hypothetical protein
MNASRIRNFLTNVSVAFVPLGFLGGLLDGNLALAFASAIFWFIVFLVIRPRN